MPPHLRSSENLPWRPGNRFRLLNDGAEFFARMLDAIEDARSYVLLEMYLVESGSVAERFIDALTRAAARGVQAAVLLDGFGSLSLTTADRRKLSDAGVELRFFNVLGWRKRLANFLRDHRKLLLIDGHLAFVGGAGLTDDFFHDSAPGCPWRDVMVEMHGPVVADWQRVFMTTWRSSGGQLSPQPAPAPHVSPDGAAGRVSISEGWHRSPLARSVLQRIDSATERAWIMSAYFVPPRRLRKALRRAARRGVDVRLVVPGARTDHPWVRHAARRFFGKMLRNNVRIFEFQPRVLHAKMVICDDWVSIGSANLDRWNTKWNLEANQEVDDRMFASLVATTFARDCQYSLELDRRRWSRRALMNRIQEHIAGAIDRWLERWRRPRLPKL
jgi:phosphatidylserine/phosphatidylglycerophosphate/cardiolipin synthase-like enzyme